MIEVNEGHKEIRKIQLKFNGLIENAPIKGGYNRHTGTYRQTQRDYQKAKFNAIKEIVQDYAVFGIELLSDAALMKLQPKEESDTERYKRELGE